MYIIVFMESIISPGTMGVNPLLSYKEFFSLDSSR